MIKHNWSVLCDSSSIDSETNRVSLFNVLDTLTIVGDPGDVQGIPIRFEIFSMWENTIDTPSEGVMRLIAIDPNGETRSPLEVRIDLTSSHFHRSRIQIQGLKLSGPGRYVFRIEYKDEDKDWKSVAELPILINFESSPNKT